MSASRYRKIENTQLLPLPVLRERAGVRVFPATRKPLTPTLSPAYRGEGAFRKASRWLVTALLSFGLFTETGRAAVVILKDSDEPVVGYLVRKDRERVVIREVRPDGKSLDRSFRLDEIRDLLITVSPERLAGLRRDEPQAYRDYAEELAEKRQDPEARDTALRLYLIAASLDPPRFARSSLLGMADLARSRDEEAKFRALAYLLDPEHDPALLKLSASVAAQVKVADKTGHAGLLQALRHLRRGELEAARRGADRPPVKAAFVAIEETLSFDDFIAACSQKPIDPALLRRVLTCELRLADPVATAAPSKVVPAAQPEERLWFPAVQRDGTAPVAVLTLDRITEFDPRHCVFRGNEWVAP